MDKQHETANEDKVESKSDEPTVDKTTISNQETSKCITPEEVKESEIIAAQESNVSKDISFCLLVVDVSTSAVV
jgi:hypothetical protein